MAETKALAFYGASDDLIEVEGDLPGCDEYTGEGATFTVAGLRVYIEYGAAGVWEIGIGQIHEDVPVTAENLRLSVPARDDGDPGYSMRLDMDVPAGTSVTEEARSDA